MDWDALLVGALEAGLSVEGFWALTPRETWMALRVARERLRMAHRRDAWLAWHVAAMVRAKRMPALGRLMPAAPAKRLTPDEARERREEFEALRGRMGETRRQGDKGRRSRGDEGDYAVAALGDVDRAGG